MADPSRPARATVDLAAVRSNVAVLRQAADPAAVWAVVKADGYGHGAVPVARAALDAGASGLCVALVDEGRELREAGIEAPVLVLAEPPPHRLADAAWLGLTLAVYSPETVEALRGTAATVHLKIDTGMHRVGARPDDAVRLAVHAAEAGLIVEGVFTHLAVADEPRHPFTALQLDRFDAVLARLRSLGLEPPLVHCANSAGALVHERTRRSLVRCGIAVYGIRPAPALRPWCDGLVPALRFTAEVSFVQRLRAGERASYGLRWEAPCDTVVATVPVGYADGVPRRLFACGGEVLVGGRRCGLAGVVTMDQLLVDCGPGADVRRGDEVVLLGRQGTEEVTAEEWAERLGTIAYEITCGIGARVPRHVVGAPSAGG